MVKRSWDELVTEGRRATSDRNWRLGDLAREVETSYGQDTLERYAAEIGVAYSTLRDYHATTKAWENVDRSTFSSVPWTVFYVLNTHDFRFEVIHEGMTVPEARSIVASRTRPPEPKPAPEPEDGKQPGSGWKDRTSFGSGNVGGTSEPPRPSPTPEPVPKPVDDVLEPVDDRPDPDPNEHGYDGKPKPDGTGGHPFGEEAEQAQKVLRMEADLSIAIAYVDKVTRGATELGREAIAGALQERAHRLAMLADGLVVFLDTGDLDQELEELLKS